MSEAALTEWDVKPLSQLAEARRGITYSSAMLKSEEGGLPYINMKSFLKGGGFNVEGTKHYAGTFTQQDIVGERDLLIANTDVTSGDIIGVPALLPEELAAEQVLYSHHVTRLRINGEVSVPFLYYLLCLPEYRSQMLRIARGTTVLMLDMPAIKRITIRAPKNKTEQNRIVEILSMLGKAIEKTETLIAKYQQIKAGLMHDLFTRGVTADGKLRTPREQAPELYQETPIGWIPKEWGCEPLEELLAAVGNSLRSGPFGSALLKSELVENGIPFLGIDNIHTEHFEATFRRFVSQNKFLTLNRYAVRPRDVAITIMGTVGRCCVLPEDIGDALSSKHLWTITFDQSQVIPELVCWQLNYAPWVLSWFKRRAQGAVMDAIQSSTLKTLTLPVPPMPEQQEIFKKYASCNSKIESEQGNLRKLKMEKVGLMHDLLTGKVRIKPESKIPELAGG